MPRDELTTVVSERRSDEAILVEVMLPVRRRRPDASARGGLGLSSKPASRPKIPRITRLMALAIKFQDMLDSGDVRDCADIARLGYVSRARLTQIMNLRHLAPDIQTSLLNDRDGRHAPLTTTERDLREVSRMVLWADQRQVLSRIHEPAANGFVKTKNGKKARKKASVVAEIHRPLSFA